MLRKIVIGLVGLGVASSVTACGSSGRTAQPAPTNAPATSMAVPTSTTPTAATLPPPTTTVPLPPSTTITSSTSPPPSSSADQIASEGLDWMVQYIMAGYCTPNGEIDGCEVATGSDSDVAAPLAPGANKTIGYDLCSAAVTNTNYYCGGNDSEAILDAQAFPSSAAANAYLQSQQGQQWETGWQFNNWAILIASSGTGLPGSELDKIEKSLASAATINNGQPYDGSGVTMDLSRIF